jgi:hypothetical protein
VNIIDLRVGSQIFFYKKKVTKAIALTINERRSVLLNFILVIRLIRKLSPDSVICRTVDYGGGK